MLKQITIAAAALAITPVAHASSTGLMLNDDSFQVIHIADAAPLLGHDIRQAYNFIYSQEPDPRNTLLSVENELQEYAWNFLDDHTITPRLDLMVSNFVGAYFAAAAAGFSYQLAPGEWHPFVFLTEATVAPPLTTFRDGKSIWSFKMQINYSIGAKAEFNAGYRSITMQLPNNFADGFERGLYFGFTNYFE